MLAIGEQSYWPSHVVAILLVASSIAAKPHNASFNSASSTHGKELSLAARTPLEPPANPRQEYESAIQVGIQRMSWFRGLPPKPLWQLSDLADNGWGWISRDPPPGEYPISLSRSMQDIYEAIGIRFLPPGPTWYVKQNHAGHTERAYGTWPAGTPYSATAAKYYNAVFPGQGVITSLDNISPQAMKEQDPTLKVPPLSQLSDVVALTWDHAKYRTGTKIRANTDDLKWWFRWNVRGGNTKFIMMHICSMKGTTLPPEWPGWRFSRSERKVRSHLQDTIANSEQAEGLALLGSRHGSAIAYGLAQYGDIWLRSVEKKKKSKSGGESDPPAPPSDLLAPFSVHMFRTDEMREDNHGNHIPFHAWNLGFEIKGRNELPPMLDPALQSDVGPAEGEAGPSNPSGSTANDQDMADSGDAPDDGNVDEEMDVRDG